MAYIEWDYTVITSMVEAQGWTLPEHDSKEWVQFNDELGEGIVIDYELVKINDHRSHSFYTVKSLEEFSGMLDTEWAREWDKANNCKDIIYKLELVE